MSHEQIPLDAGMWLDDLSPPSATPRASSSSLADSLQLLQDHSAAFTDDTDALFPMLSDATFEDPDDHKPRAFPDDLSPIRTPKAATKASSARPRNGPSLPSTPMSGRKKSPRGKAATPASTIGVAIPFPDFGESKPTVAIPTTSRKRRRRLRSTSLTAALTHWNDHEQNVFFAVFKPKWAIETPTPEQFAMLLLERFDAVSDKLTDTHKTSHDVEAFYNAMVQAITDLLDAVVPHDIDLLDADEVRVALWCWYKMFADEPKRTALEQLEDADDELKRPLAQELLQSIVRSRRQMLKAKSTQHAAAAADMVLPAGLDAAEEMASLEGLLREALEHSSLPSYLYQLAPVEANAAPVVHHPVVRRKSNKQHVRHEPASTPLKSQKRERSESMELYHSITNGTPLQSLTPASSGSRPSHGTPSVRNPSKKAKHESQNQTPQQSTRKKIYIKLRMVPRDTQTKNIVEQCGCNPKVELKLNSVKKVSDVLNHMTKKWAKVSQRVDKRATLHFFQKDNSVSSPELSSNLTHPDPSKKSWSRRNHDVTCLDIWKQSGKMKNDEYIAVVSYQWCVDDSIDPNSSLTAWVEDSTQLLDILDREMASTKKQLMFDHDDCSSQENSPFASPLNLSDPPKPSDIEHGAAQIQPLERQQSLQAFSETVAFNNKPIATAEATEEEQLSLASLPEDALSELMEFSPNSQKMRRRRITPVLVATNECEI